MANPREQIKGLGCLGLILLVVAFAVYWGVTSKRQHDRNEKRKESFAPFVDQISPPRRDAPRAAAWRAGRVLVVSMHQSPESQTESTQIDPIFFDLPESLQAGTPDEAKTIIYLVDQPERVGTYADGSAAWRNNCTVYLIDSATQWVIEGQFFRGADPPSYTRGGPRGGGRSDAEIIQYILTLPKSKKLESAPPQPDRIFFLSSLGLQAMATTRVTPTYPPSARAARVEGGVVIQVTVDEKGNVISAEALAGPHLLKHAAIDAVRLWKFKPTELQGAPVKTRGTVTIWFNLSGG